VSEPAPTAASPSDPSASPRPAVDPVEAFGIRPLDAYARIIDARSPREYADDHVPGAINLPVVDDAQYAEVGTRHRTDPHAAYVVGVGYALRNIATQIDTLIAGHAPHDRFLVYCFRGGKRSRLWADALATIGFEVDVLAGGWKRYRRWVLAGLDAVPGTLRWQVVCGPTGGGKTRWLAALARAGAQVLDLEALACHRGSLLGDLPGVAQPPQKRFESALFDALRRFDPARPVWIEAESPRLGRLRLPAALVDAMRAAPVVDVVTPMAVRVQLWHDDYAHFAAAPRAMVDRLAGLRALVGHATFTAWQALADAGDTGSLFERVMVDHYDPCYRRSLRQGWGDNPRLATLTLDALDAASLDRAVAALPPALRG
jgi:tRNA 2-selenouridine synthase